jgi:hypothetical protein
VDILGHARGNRSQKSLDFIGFARSHELYLAVRQISHIALDHVLTGYPPSGHAKANPLHGSPIVDTFAG